MKYLTYTLAVLVFVLLAALFIEQVQNRDNGLIYVGDCVDIVADREGATELLPKEKWDAFADYCMSRYKNR